MSRRGSRGTAGTLRRLGPSSSVYRPRQQPLCMVQISGDYLAGIGPAPERTPMVDVDPQRALKMPRDTAAVVARELCELGWSAELVPAMKRGGVDA